MNFSFYGRDCNFLSLDHSPPEFVPFATLEKGLG